MLEVLNQPVLWIEKDSFDHEIFVYQSFIYNLNVGEFKTYFRVSANLLKNPNWPRLGLTK